MEREIAEVIEAYLSEVVRAQERFNEIVIAELRLLAVSPETLRDLRRYTETLEHARLWGPGEVLRTALKTESPAEPRR